MVSEQLQSIMREVFDDESIDIFPEMTADDVDDWDSLSHIDLIVSIETEFGIKLSVDDMINLKNVGDIIGLIETKVAS